MVNSDYHLIFGNPDPMRQNTNSFEAENARHNLFILVKLVIKVNELISRQHADKKSSMVLQKLFENIFNAWEQQTYKLSNALWSTFRHCNGMDSLINNNCASEYEIEQLEQLVDGFKFNLSKLYYNLNSHKYTYIFLTEMCVEKRTPVLNSDSEEASNASKARIKKQHGKKSMFRAINVLKPMEKVAICSNDTASRLADQSCQLIVEEVPYRLSISVHQWSAEDVCKWFKKNGFSEFANNLLENRVDGDLLLRLTEDELKNEIGIHNGILKNRFIRELNSLKQSADYSSIDTTDLNSFLKSINSEYSMYTYPMLNAGVKRDSMRLLTDDQLKNDCGISNGVHRNCILASIKEMPVYVENKDKPYDVFISYKRSTDSQLASLLKVYLKIQGYNVFLDVKRSGDAKSRHHVLQTIRQTKNFIIVLTPGSLDKNFMDSSSGVNETLDFICKEVMTAEQAQCNIIPVLDNSFTWPPPPLLPDDLKNLCNYNSISWVHEYQEACVKKLVTFVNQF